MCICYRFYNMWEIPSSRRYYFFSFWFSLLPFHNFDDDVPSCTTDYDPNHNVKPRADAQGCCGGKGKGKSQGIPETEVGERWLLVVGKESPVNCFKWYKKNIFKKLIETTGTEKQLFNYNRSAKLKTKADYV